MEVNKKLYNIGQIFVSAEIRGRNKPSNNIMTMDGLTSTDRDYDQHFLETNGCSKRPGSRINPG